MEIYKEYFENLPFGLVVLQLPAHNPGRTSRPGSMPPAAGASPQSGCCSGTVGMGETGRRRLPMRVRKKMETLKYTFLKDQSLLLRA